MKTFYERITVVTTQHPPSMMRVPTALIFHKLDFRLIPNQC